MGKLTKAQRAQIDRALSAVNLVQSYLDDSRIAVCRIDDKATTALHYTRAFVPGLDREGGAKPLYPVAKDIGSALALLPDAIKALQSLYLGD